MDIQCPLRVDTGLSMFPKPFIVDQDWLVMRPLILVAQSMVEGITLLTADPLAAQYRGPVRRV